MREPADPPRPFTPEQVEADELETLRMMLAACTTAAIGNTLSTVARRLQPGHPYYSASYRDVCDAVDREMALREELARLLRQPPAEREKEQ